MKKVENWHLASLIRDMVETWNARDFIGHTVALFELRELTITNCELPGEIDEMWNRLLGLCRTPKERMMLTLIRVDMDKAINEINKQRKEIL